MSLDEGSPGAAHKREVRAQLRRDYHAAEYPDDAGSPEAEEAMHHAGLARLRVTDPWMFTGSDASAVDGRCFDMGTDERECWRGEAS